MPRGQFDRSARKARTREQLLAAAARVYARRGLAGATLDEVAAEAGFTKGAVYGHFAGKESLLMAVMEEHLESQVARQLELFDSDLESARQPLAGAASWMAHIEQDPDALRLFIELWLYAQHDERMSRRLADSIEMLRSTFARFAMRSARDGDGPTPTEARQFANIALALGIGLSTLKMIDPQAVSDALLGNTLSVVIGALQSDPLARDRMAVQEPGAG